MNFKAGDSVALKRDIYRIDSLSHENLLYATAGSCGIINEVFKVGHPPDIVWHAKVDIDNHIFIFRLTSLEKVRK